ncbi:MAG: hypothetical protein KJ709_03215 [Nanoarchaeota archaeon]|nr:hypothetical protein [Nanoarchaeota archaeon]
MNPVVPVLLSIIYCGPCPQQAEEPKPLDDRIGMIAMRMMNSENSTVREEDGALIYEQSLAAGDTILELSLKTVEAAEDDYGMHGIFTPDDVFRIRVALPSGKSRGFKDTGLDRAFSEGDSAYGVPGVDSASQQDWCACKTREVLADYGRWLDLIEKGQLEQALEERRSGENPNWCNVKALYR